LNLLSNAAKFTDAGEIVVTVTTDRATVTVVVEDTGAGIPPDQLPFIFDKFRQVDGSSSRRVGGTGLGLAIVRHIVTRHRGVLQFDSQEGAGTTVFVWLPTVAATGAATAASAAQATAGPAAD
jgi:signal transduction histidine kinase